MAAYRKTGIIYEVSDEFQRHPIVFCMYVGVFCYLFCYFDINACSLKMFFNFCYIYNDDDNRS